MGNAGWQRNYMKNNPPKKGDIILISLFSVEGHEQKGVRPALVVTDQKFNKQTGFCWIVPVTSVQKKYPFEIILSSKKTKGVVLADQIRSIDWGARKVKKIDNVSKNCLRQVIQKIEIVLS